MRKPLPIIGLLAAIACGCHTARDATRSEIDFDLNKLERTGHLAIRSPKDSELVDLWFAKTGTNYVFSIGKYKAVVSAASVEAARSESEFRAMTWNRVMNSLDLLAEKAAASQGVPQTQTHPRMGNPSFLGVRLMYDESTGYWVEDTTITPAKPK